MKVVETLQGMKMMVMYEKETYNHFYKKGLMMVEKTSSIKSSNVKPVGGARVFKKELFYPNSKW